MPVATNAVPLSAGAVIQDQTTNFSAAAESGVTSSFTESQDLNLQPDSAPSAIQSQPAPFLSTLPERSVDASYREYERGNASWYGHRFNNRRTASGARYDMHAFTAAHPTLPFGTIVRLRSIDNGHEVDVRINDRGPSGGNRVIDVSRAAAKKLGMLGHGVHNVVLLVLESMPLVSEPLAPVRASKRPAQVPPKAVAR